MGFDPFQQPSVVEVVMMLKKIVQDIFKCINIDALRDHLGRKVSEDV